MRRRRCVLLACSLGVASMWLAWMVPLGAYDPEQSNSRGPTGYRGCVISNFNTADAGQEIVCDFGSQGIWAFAVADQGWHRLTDQNPNWIFSCRPGGATSAAYLVASFSSGVWAWHYSGYPGTWTQLTPSVATAGFATDDDADGHDELQLAFANGVWRHDFDTHGWLHYTSTVPSGGRRSDMGAWGWQEGLWSFNGQGMWLFYMVGAVPEADKLTASVPYFSNVVAAHFDPAFAAEGVIADFAASGTWIAGSNIGAPGWSLMTPSSPFALTPIHSGTSSPTVPRGSVSPTVSLPVYNLIFADNTGIPWQWSKAGGFVQMTSSVLEPGFCEPYAARGLADPSGRQQAACDFGAQGLWEYDQAGTWKQLTISNPLSMVRGDFYGDGVQDTLVVDFGSSVGLWMYRLGRWPPRLTMGQAHAERSR